MPPDALFRSEEMSLIQLYIPMEVAQPCIAELGDLGKVQFRDLNPDVNAFQRSFVNEIRRFDEMERQCRYFRQQIKRGGVPFRPLTGTAVRARSTQEIDNLEELLREHEQHLLEMTSSYESLQQRYLQLTELRHVLRETALFFNQAESRQEVNTIGNLDEADDIVPLLERDDEEENIQYELGQLSIGVVTGVIARSRMQTFERVLWRSLRGNLYMNSSEIDEPIVDLEDNDNTVDKNVFAVFAHGQEIINKIRRISESMGATLYDIDPSEDKRRDALLEVTSRIEDLNNVLSNTNQTRRAELITISENLNAWTIMVRKEKAIYHTMNLFNYDAGRKCLIAEGWCPSFDIPSIQYALKEATDASGASLSAIVTELRTNKKPPTFQRTNKFTEGFQAIIDAYGIARYREVNPGIFTLISFPFLFAVMFGDIGHGALMFLAALYLVLNEKKLESNNGEIFRMFFSGRYMMLMMGIFSIFTGFMYNDLFSLSLSTFKSGFDWPTTYNSTDAVEGIPNGNTYAIGLDPAWHGAENFLLFTNPYKMKQAIILGVIHMSFAICLNVINNLHFRKKIFIWLEFVPQILFMESIFGYLVFCIMYKWSVDWYARDADGVLLRGQPPNLLNMLIYMFLSPGTIIPGEQLYSGQGPIQVLLLLIAVICVPWMWFAKPYYLKKQHSMHQYASVADDEHINEEDILDIHNSTATGAIDDPEEEEFDFSEEMIHQTIHTIEFCLNCISNTASYLRLWALSLAHAQLSSVLWDMTLKIWFNFTGFVGTMGLVIGFAVWFSLTCFILIGMEGLSAFLHTLRLHWVEFDGKFYAADGYAFQPFSFRSIILEDEE
ncbi:V-type ATPase, V0 complex, 116kDa subunit family [Halteromyces radiatus]|uniref:V-type ATPase, V0 complex, 116kDa subunit family n=1 Tax=Halteromyces radiatus TaxID=101107 RepID=UPI0022206042|nr:V-type ATPase, V0 complex, 116kDa subunit family [Halteromyces radiatus]KAI8098874.1 V-type ATPase, V0 complex, 116kDa subunit family [Halteromyces radiatus]